jgi:hypothetical protein
MSKVTMIPNFRTYFKYYQHYIPYLINFKLRVKRVFLWGIVPVRTFLHSNNQET